MTRATAPVIDRLPDMENVVSDAAEFARVATYLADQILSHGRKEGLVQMMTWEADMLTFALNQAKFAAGRCSDRWDELMDGKSEEAR